MRRRRTGLLCLFVRGRGYRGWQAGGGGWLSFSPFPSHSWFCFLLCSNEGRAAHGLMLFAWQCIMHQMIHKLLSLFYHLQRINNGTLASCFFSICHCSLSNSVCADWLAQFCPCCMSPQKSTLNQTLWALYFIAVDLLPVTTCRDCKMGFHYREVSGEYPLPPMLAGFPRQLLHTIFHIWSNLVTPETHKVAFFFFSLLLFFFSFSKSDPQLSALHSTSGEPLTCGFLLTPGQLVRRFGIFPTVWSQSRPNKQWVVWKLPSFILWVTHCFHPQGP